MATASGPVQVRVEGLPELRRALRKFAPEVDKSFRKRLRTVAVVVAADAKGRASWSRRIPRAIKPGVTAKGAQITVRAAIAPHGPLYEGDGSSGSFRHPLFGDRGHWYQQQRRPFVRPAVAARASYIESEAGRAIDDAKREVDLR
jgi:hypothetical protein